VKYANGRTAEQGDKVRTVDSQEDCFLRVVGINNMVTVWHHTWDVARVYCITEIEPRETTR
jgi:hypothetical protein